MPPRQVRSPDVSQMATKAELPQPAQSAPPDTTSDTQRVGASDRYALEDHTHPTRVQRGTTTLASDGLAKWLFATPFDNEPNIPNPSYREQADNLPIVIRIKDFYREKNTSGVAVAGGVLESGGGTGKYVGVQFRAQRLQNNGGIAGATILNLSLSLNIAGGAIPAGLKIYCQAAPNT